jgi:AraC family transcriptional regulator, regulatory protein of adaptative response / DNA-3-methyladenine glycosylase II
MSGIVLGMELSSDDEERWYRSVASKDPRFDGWIFVGVTSTGIYCRPSCPAMTPKRSNMRFFKTAAAAQGQGFRACKRCRPDASPGSPAWNQRADLVGRAMGLIVDGLVDREGVEGLARALGYSERHLNRQLVAEVGAGPLALAQSQRAQNARILIETTSLTFSEIAFASGFSSIRQFNEIVRSVFALTPTKLRQRSRTPIAKPRPLQAVGERASVEAGRSGAATSLSIRLPFRKPFAGSELLNFLQARAVATLESVSAGSVDADPTMRYERSLRLAYGAATCSLVFGPDAIQGTFHLEDIRDMSSAVHRCRRLLDLDADPVAVSDSLANDPVIGELVQKVPGLRVPGHIDGFEVAIRAIVGQQVSVSGARTTLGKITLQYGDVLPPALRERSPSLERLFPTPAALAEADPATLGVPRSRGATIVRVAEHFASGRIQADVGADREETMAALLDVKGIGPWTATYVRLRAFSDPDCFLPTDLGVKHAFAARGLPVDERSVAKASEAWSPWRSYALMHLWNSL